MTKLNRMLFKVRPNSVSGQTRRLQSGPGKPPPSPSGPSHPPIDSKSFRNKSWKENSDHDNSENRLRKVEIGKGALPSDARFPKGTLKGSLRLFGREARSSRDSIEGAREEPRSQRQIKNALNISARGDSPSGVKSQRETNHLLLDLGELGRSTGRNDPGFFLKKDAKAGLPDLDRSGQPPLKKRTLVIEGPVTEQKPPETTKIFKKVTTATGRFRVCVLAVIFASYFPKICRMHHWGRKQALMTTIRYDPDFVPEILATQLEKHVSGVWETAAWKKGFALPDRPGARELVEAGALIVQSFAGFAKSFSEQFFAPAWKYLGATHLSGGVDLQGLLDPLLAQSVSISERKILKFSARAESESLFLLSNYLFWQVFVDKVAKNAIETSFKMRMVAKALGELLEEHWRLILQPKTQAKRPGSASASGPRPIRLQDPKEELRWKQVVLELRLKGAGLADELVFVVSGILAVLRRQQVAERLTALTEKIQRLTDIQNTHGRFPEFDSYLEALTRKMDRLKAPPAPLLSPT